MDVYSYMYGDAIGDFVVIGPHDDKVLIYSVKGNRFHLALAPVVECCTLLCKEERITVQDLINSYVALQVWLAVNTHAKEDPGQQNLLKACHHYYDSQWKSEDPDFVD